MAVGLFKNDMKGCKLTVSLTEKGIEVKIKLDKLMSLKNYKRMHIYCHQICFDCQDIAVKGWGGVLAL